MKLFIPDIGTHLKLDSDLSFTLLLHRHNISMFTKLEQLNISKNERCNKIITLPKGLILKVKSVNIRRASSLSNICFSIPKPKVKKDFQEMPLNEIWHSCSFCVLLNELNGIDYEPVFGNIRTHEKFNEFYTEILRDSSKSFGYFKCQEILKTLNRNLGSGLNVNNLKTTVEFDHLLEKIIEKIKKNEIQIHPNYLLETLKKELRHSKITEISE